LYLVIFIFVIPDNWLTGAKAEEDRIGAFDASRSVSPFVSPQPFNDLGCNRAALSARSRINSGALSVLNIISGDDVTLSSRSSGEVEGVSISARTYGGRRVGLSKRNPYKMEEDESRC
jgi:hypothetical protein